MELVQLAEALGFSADRPEEYLALNMPYNDRGNRFRDSFAYISARTQATGKPIQPAARSLSGFPF